MTGMENIIVFLYIVCQKAAFLMNKMMELRRLSTNNKNYYFFYHTKSTQGSLKLKRVYIL